MQLLGSFYWSTNEPKIVYNTVFGTSTDMAISENFMAYSVAQSGKANLK
jgi:hypothetical protein